VTPVEPPQDPHRIPPEYRILDAIDLALLLVGEDLTIIRANTAFRRLTGGEPGEVPGEAAGRVRAATGDGIPEFECLLHAQDGRERRCRCSGRRVPSGEGWLLLFRETPDDHEAIVEYTGTATILIEGDGTISVANTEFERLSGYSRSELVGIKRLTEFVASDDERERIAGYHTLRRQEPGTAPMNYAFVFIDRSGTTHAVEVTIGLIPGTNRSVMSLLDVTERKRAERALQESEERLNLALSAANDGLVDWNVHTGAIYYSPRSFTMLGYEPETFVPTLSSALALIHPEERGRVEAVLADMASGVCDRCEIEVRMRSASGQWIDVLDRLRVVARDGSGAPVRVVGTHTDITERKRAERELLAREMAVESSLAAIAIADLDGRLTYANRALLAMGGFTETDEVLGKHLSAFWTDPLRVEGALRTLAQRGVSTGELVGRKADGTEFIAHVTANIVTDAPGRPVCIMATAIDLTAQKRIEQELRIKDLAIASSLDAITLTGPDGRIAYVNRAFLSMHGCEREEEIVGQPALVLWADPEEAERVIGAFRRDGTWIGEVEGRRQDGSTFPMQFSLSPVTDESGRRIGTMGWGTDITRRKEVERELRIKDMAIASSPSAFSIADLDGRHTYVNQAFLSLWGYDSPAEVIGRSVGEFWLDGGILTRTGRYTGERIGKRRDKTTFCAMFSGNVVTDEAGVPIGRAASLIDITDLKRAETEVKAHNRILSVLNQIVGVSIATTDIDEMMQDVLAATLALLDLTGGGIHLIEGRSARLTCAQGLPEGLLLHRCIPDITVPPLSKALVAGEPLFFDGEGGLPPYAVIPLLAHEKVVGALNVVNREGTGFTGVDRSLLTAIGRGIGSSLERAMLIRQLEVAEREANLYLDILGHDIRNAENISGLYADLLVDALTGKEKEYAQRIRSSIRKSIEILRNVSTIRRIRHESASLSPIDLDEVIRDEITIFSGCRIRYGGTGVMVMADALLAEVFTNLIGNAVKFGGPAAEITIRVEEPGDEVVVVVEDTGPGVPDDMKEAIFMRFGQSRHRKSGQGLGLSITRMLVERYGGRIRVDDRIPGNPEEGAAFRFTLKKA